MAHTAGSKPFAVTVDLALYDICQLELLEQRVIFSCGALSGKDYA
jgi:hypothetical protein